jgi:xanthine dehydrogenase small subunit
MGTIGGNIANGSPIGDTPPVLIALGATVTLRRGNERRVLALEDFFIAYGKQDRAPGEFVESVFVPRPGPGTLNAAYKVSKRRDEDISAVACGFLVTIEGGVVTLARLVYGGMAATPKRAAKAEASLLGRPWTAETVAEAEAALAEDFTPLTDWRATASYRAMLARNLLRRFWLESAGAPVRLRRELVA